MLTHINVIERPQVRIQPRRYTSVCGLTVEAAAPSQAPQIETEVRGTRKFKIVPLEQLNKLNAGLLVDYLKNVLAKEVVVYRKLTAEKQKKRSVKF